MSDVTMVAYGDEIHLYDMGDESAKIVYTVAIGANLDAIVRNVPAAKVATVCDAVREGAPETTIHDHRQV